MSLVCRFVERRLPAWLDAERQGAAPALAERFAGRHAQRCLRCAASAARLRALDRELAALRAPDLVPPAPLRLRLLDALERETRSKARATSPAPLSHAAVAALGSAAALVLLLSLLWSRWDMLGPAPREVRIRAPEGYLVVASPRIRIQRGSGAELVP